MKQFIKVFSAALVLLLAAGLLPVMSMKAYAAAASWQVGDTFNVNGKWFYNVDIDNGNRSSCVTINKTVPSPEYYKGFGQWVFSDILYDPAVDYVYSLFLTKPSDKAETEIPKGFRIKSGSGTENDPYTLELVYPDPVAVTGVTLFSADTMRVGETIMMVAEIQPNNATDRTVKWSVSSNSVKLYTDEACTTEVGSGAVSNLKVYAKGISAGCASVTVTTNDQNKTASCDVTVGAVAWVATAPAAKSLTYSGSAQELVTAGAAVNGTMRYALGSDTEAAGAFSGSIPTETNAGTYYVWYKAAGDEGYEDSSVGGPVTVTISKANPPLPTGLTATLGQTLADVALPDGWTWDNPSKVLNSIGQVIATARFEENENYNSRTAAVTVTVSSVAVTGVKLDKTTLTVNEGDTATLTATVIPADANEQGVTFSSGNEAVVTVDNTGKVTAVAPGKTTVTVKTVEGNKTATCEVTVPFAVKNTSGNGGKHIKKKDDTLLFVFEIVGHDPETATAFSEAHEEVSVTGNNYSRQLSEGSDFSAESGSLKLTLNKSYLDSLAPGDYTVTAAFTMNDLTKYGTSSFKVTAPSGGSGSTPGTGDGTKANNIVSAMILFLLSLSFLAYWAYTDERFSAKLPAVPAGISSFFRSIKNDSVDAPETAFDEPENIVFYDASLESASESDGFDDITE